MPDTTKPNLRDRIAGLSWETIIVTAILVGAVAGTAAR